MHEVRAQKHEQISSAKWIRVPDSKVHLAHMGPTWVLSAPGGPHVAPLKFAIRGIMGVQLL